jgi:class 3 adenylate cyclase
MDLFGAGIVPGNPNLHFMRRYWTFAMAIGGGSALLGLVLSATGLMEPLVKAVGDWYRAKGFLAVEPAGRVRWAEFTAVAFVPVGLAFAMIEATKSWEKVVVASAVLGLSAALSPLLALYGVLFDVIPLLVACVIAILGAAGFARTEFGSRKRFLERALGTRVSSRVFFNLLDSAHAPLREGGSREVTTVVCRLLSAGEAESIGAEDALRRGSWFLRAVSSFLLSRGAYLEEAGPERIRAVFGIFGNEDDHAVSACRTACDLRGRLRGLAREFESRWFHPLAWGVGVNSGTMSVGLCGEPGRYLFAGVGGGADFADRLALANARLASDVLLGPDTYRLIRDRFEVRPLEQVYDPLSCQLLEVYQLLAPAEAFSDEERQRRDCFWQGIIQLRQRNFEGALESFSRARVPGGEDAPLALLLERAREEGATPGARPMRLIREFTDEGRARLLERL